MKPQIEITTLGGLEIRKNGAALNGLASRKAEALLVYLAANDKAHPREVLADLLWDDRTTTQTLGNLRVLLTSLRKEIGDELDITRQSVRLHPSPAWRIDALEFEKNIHAQQRSKLVTLTSESAHALETTLAYYHGDFLQGIYFRESSRFEEWATLTRERLHLAAITALEQLIDFYKRCGEYAKGIQAAQRLLQFDPLREETHYELILLLARNGQRQAALQQYEICRELLEKELRLSPAPKTVSLHQKLIHAASAYRNNLPTYSTPFIAREDDLKRVTDLLRQPNCRLLTLLGPGGIGKSRLAVQAASQMTGELLNGVVFVPLATVNTSDAVTLAILDAFKLTSPSQENPEDQLVKALKEQELLLVLDNFEQLSTETRLITRLIQEIPGVKIIVTSRLRLNLQSEQILNVSGLEIPSTRDVDMESFGAIQLFYQVARRVNSDFELSEKNLLHVIRICELVMGAPLGIELAAAWSHTLNPLQIMQAIENDLSILFTNSADVPERHQSFQAVFAHSWSLLSPQERIAFCRLSVFRGGFSYEATRDAASIRLAELSGLVDKSFIQRDGSGRYSIHELLRQFGSEKCQACLPQGEDPQLDYATYYIQYLAQREADLCGPRQLEALQQITTEQENLRAGWQWAITHQKVDLLTPALESLISFYDMRGNYLEASLLLEPLTNLPEDNFAGWVYAAQGWFADRLAKYDQALMLGQSSLKIFKHTGDLRGQANALANLGMNAIYRGKLDEAEGYLQTGLALTQSINDETCIARSLSLLGVVYKQKGDFAKARVTQEKALAMFRSIGNPQRIASSANNLGIVLRIQGEYEAARSCYEENLSIRRRLSDQRGIALALVNLANLLAQMGQMDAARIAYEESLIISEEINDLWGKALCLHNLGDLARLHKNFSKASVYYQQSLALRRRLDDQTGMAYSLASLGHIYVEQDQIAQATIYFHDAVEMALQNSLMPVVIDALGGMVVLHHRSGNSEKVSQLAQTLLSQSSIEPQLRKQIMDFQIKANLNFNNAAEHDLKTIIKLAFDD